MSTIANEPWAELRTTLGLVLIGAGALALLGNQGSGIIQPTDPLTGVSSRFVFWIVGIVSELLGVACLFLRRSIWPLFVTAQLALGLLMGCVGLGFVGTYRIGPFFDTMAMNFGLGTAPLVGAAYVCTAFCLVSALLILKPRPHTLKMSCHACGGHLEFAALCLGEDRVCPHCATTITLRGSQETLRTCCYFCKGPIEFYAHLTGRKIACPHCRKEITLKMLNEIVSERKPGVCNK